MTLHQIEPVPLKEWPDGTIRVGDSRVGIHYVVEAFKNGASAEQIADDYETLTLVEIYGVITYYLRHTDEVNAYIREHHAAEEAAYQDHLARPGVREWRERISRRIELHR